MVETGILLSLAIPAFLLVYIAFKLSENHSVLKMLFTSTGLVFLLGVPFTGYKFALENGHDQIASYLIYFELALIITFVVFVFYLIWLYIKSVGLVMSGSEEEFRLDERGD